jgi:hypothetical protein|tara:strand:+ start:2430 stop:2762 length:333 start_codon:yes stop_codon:yes gene_type:complete
VQEKLIDEIISIENQSFHLSILKYSNGCFISLTEGNEPRFGSMSMSLKQSNLVNTTIIIPSKFSPTIQQLISELASDLSNGIGLSSVYITKELKMETAVNIIQIIRSYLK